MSETLRIVFGPDYSIEQRRLSRHAFTATSQVDYLVAFFASSATRDTGCSIILSNPGESVSTNEIRHRKEMLILRLEAQVLIETAIRMRLHHPGTQINFRESGTEITDDARLAQLLGGLSSEMKTAAPGWRDVLSAMVRQIAVHLIRVHTALRRADELELSRVGLIDRRLRRAIEFMHVNCGRDLKLAEIAAESHLSAFHFARLFKKVTNTTPLAYLVALRIEKSRRLLAETSLSLSEVGAHVGYESQSHFTRLFRQTVGMTPRAYREAAQDVRD